MSDLIHSVADLIDERDRENLETTLARVAFQFGGARTLTLWRAFRRADGVWLRRRVTIGAAGAQFPASDEDDERLELAPEPLRLACESRQPARWRARAPDGAGCVFPIQRGGDVFGLLAIESDSELDRERMSALSGVLRIYRSHLAALDYADIDELTRLANRRTFEEQFRRAALGEAGRNGERRSGDKFGARTHLGVADIDFFKQVNDRFGHPYGDEVLVLFAGLMRAMFRDCDRLFRFGGEEFVVLLANCGAEDALAALERFRSAVQAFPFPQVGEVTVSVGLTSIRPDDTGSAAFGRADQALYIAKRRGRNRVLSFETLHEGSALEAMRKSQPEIELF